MSIHPDQKEEEEEDHKRFFGYEADHNPVHLSVNLSVSEIHCSKTRTGPHILEAILKKPPKFDGDPFFPDNRVIRPEHDPDCIIRRIETDPKGLSYHLKIHNFQRCKVKPKEDYLTIRVWFPQLKGVIMANDQEVVIMCRPADPTVLRKKTAGFSGNIPHIGRVSGVVEKSHRSLEYTLALHKESSPRSGIFDMPIVGSISIGTRLQLTASIDTSSAWKFTKLMEVTVSNDPLKPNADGYITLVKNGCRNQQYGSIVPNQPQRLKNQSGSVVLKFEAFMLENMLSTDRLWIHSQVKACTEAVDCIAQFCMDLFQPSGHGKRRRRDSSLSDRYVPQSRSMPMFSANRGVNGNFGSSYVLPHKLTTDDDNLDTSFDENIGISIVIPKEETDLKEMVTDDPCWVFIIASCTSAAFLSIAIIIIVCLSCRMSAKLEEQSKAKFMMNSVLNIHQREHNTKEAELSQVCNLPPVERLFFAKRMDPTSENGQLFNEQPGRLVGTLRIK
ncbi:hypothetical protein GQR58_014098 [Nymphon striatum]|nr:hypothetical protein GQR58_014098 [Nymphon striatum]